MQTPTTPTDGAFLLVLQNHRRGQVLNELGDALRKVTEAVQETGRPGRLILDVTLRRASKGTAGTLVVESDVSTKLPKADVVGSVFFVEEGFTLSRQDPNQRTLPLEAVDGGDETENPAVQKASQT